MSKKYELKDMTGKLFKYEGKSSSNTTPNLTGIALIDGVEYRVAAWKNTPKNGGNPYFSLAFQLQEEQNKKGGKSKASSYQTDEDDEFTL